MLFHLFRKTRTQKILSAIEAADDAQISLYIRAIVHRYSRVYPDWDVMFLSLPKDPAQRRHQLQEMLEHLKEHGNF